MKNLLLRPALIAAASFLIAVVASGQNDSFPFAASSGSSGAYVTDSKGKSLYVYSGDSGGSGSCKGACAEAWPPYYAPEPNYSYDPSYSGSGGVESSYVAVSPYDDKYQYTYKGQPLYYYSKDKKPGDTYGQGAYEYDGNWYLIRPDGTWIK